MTSDLPRATELVLDVEDLSVEYGSPAGPVRTVGALDFTANPGTIYGIVGESGSGKSTFALSALGWTSSALRRTSGASYVAGRNLFVLAPRQLRRTWGASIGYVPQEVGGALHPSFKIRRQFRESLRLNCAMGRQESDARAIELLQAAGLPDPADALGRYPHQFSGGQLQRIAMALALAPRPELLVLDEPTTGLDVTTQRLVADVLRSLVKDQTVSALFISHDIALLSQYADVLVVMYAGEIVESGPVVDVLNHPHHPYTRALVDAVPSVTRPVLPVTIRGLPPGRVVDDACAFEPRCGFRVESCRYTKPPLSSVGDLRTARCLRLADLDLREPARGEPVVARPVGLAVLDAEAVSYTYPNVDEPAVRQADISLSAGSVTALVGESGSGKSTLGHVFAGLFPAQSGRLLLDGAPLPRDPRKRTQQQRQEIQLIFQSSAGSLNPRREVGSHLRHVAARYVGGDQPARAAAIADVLDAVQLSPTLLSRFPRELSGGQKQRVAIASAFLARPRVVICDEITSGQDVSVQAAILETLTGLQRSHDTAVLFISHDLGVVRAIADTVYVMKDGAIVESGPTGQVFGAPSHEYTRLLLAAVPTVPSTRSTPGGLS